MQKICMYTNFIEGVQGGTAENGGDCCFNRVYSICHAKRLDERRPSLLGYRVCIMRCYDTRAGHA